MIKMSKCLTRLLLYDIINNIASSLTRGAAVTPDISQGALFPINGPALARKELHMKMIKRGRVLTGAIVFVTLSLVGLGLKSCLSCPTPPAAPTDSPESKVMADLKKQVTDLQRQVETLQKNRAESAPHPQPPAEASDAPKPDDRVLEEIGGIRTNLKGLAESAKAVAKTVKRLEARKPEPAASAARTRPGRDTTFVVDGGRVVEVPTPALKAEDILKLKEEIEEVRAGISRTQENLEVCKREARTSPLGGVRRQAERDGKIHQGGLDQLSRRLEQLEKKLKGCVGGTDKK